MGIPVFVSKQCNLLRIKKIKIFWVYIKRPEKSLLWNTIKSVVFQTPVVQITQNQGAPMGSAMLAGVGVGLFKNLGSVVEEWVKTGKSFRATAKQKRIYKQRICEYEKILRLLSKL